MGRPGGYLLCLFALLASGHLHAARISLTWQANDPGDQVAGYRLFQTTATSLIGVTTSAATGLPYITKTTITGASNVTVEVANLTLPTTYYFRLTAFDTSDNQSAFNVALDGATQEQVTVYLPSIPSVPQSLNVTAVTSQTVSLAWNIPLMADGGDVVLERRPQGSSTFTEIRRQALTSMSYTDSGLSPSSTYYYRLWSRGIQGDSDYSTELKAITSFILDTTPPVILNPRAINIGQNSASIAWDTNELADSRVFYGLTSTTLNQTASNSSLVTSHSIPLTGLTRETTYYFRVESQDARSNNRASSVLSFRTLGDLEMVYLQEPGTNTTYFPGSVLGFRAAVKPQGDSGPPDPALLTQYTFRLRATDSQGNSYQTSLPARPGQPFAAGFFDTNQLRASGQFTWTFFMEATGPAGVLTGPSRTLSFDSSVSLTRVNNSQFSLPTDNPLGSQFGVSLPSGVQLSGVNLRRVAASEVPALPQENDTSPVFLAAYEFLVPGQRNTLFNKPVTLTLLYSDNEDADGDGVPEGDGQEDTMFVDEKTLKIFWLDNGTWRMIGGQVNPAKNSVSAKTIHFSIFALASSQALSPPMAPQIYLTPATVDGINDVAVFGLEASEVTIIDVNGRRVFHSTLAETTQSAITWSCRDEAGRMVPSGVYIAKVKQKSGALVHQTLVVVK